MSVAGDKPVPQLRSIPSPVTGTAHRIRTDLSATLFFASPEEYEGGELVVEDTFGIQRLGEHPSQLTGVYHNLLRRWADV